ncbi:MULTISPECIES: hypothetical protein [unclassified Microbacterium]|uniref:hypothetical protein n=1 Tax=unclassified Microbacterium TaxID=2609290 RepID=UPI0008DA19D2|nr:MULTISPECIES: hypothetical protein [unclassified Microbacterium]MAY48520.1 hypothetical protein [Microbacterium sp.]HBS74341.1 hypothetical protein [Microbacterium sp.]|tara:strand:+ start:199 stop:825 length:627 start_codon:yes stop_codon:yes gene_type:complete
MAETSGTEARSRDIRDIVAVVLLSTMAVLTAWCGFQASKWGGEMSIAFSQASSARVQATNFDGQARDQRQFDLTVYASWVEAQAAGQEELAAYIAERFQPEFRVAFDAWQAEGADEGGPFVQEEYVPAGSVEAAEYSALADAKFAEALENNQRGDNYSLLTVLFALVLFLTAMSQRNIAAWASRTFLGLAIVVGIAGIVILLTFPIKV